MRDTSVQSANYFRLKKNSDSTNFISNPQIMSALDASRSIQGIHSNTVACIKVVGESFTMQWQDGTLSVE